ncbi:MAG TPA: hypothetical protein VFM17_08305 [Candidatus Eisenbacteria bacterium]|jgi:hypothetical protein|nr:hypothetical protein [Candidatus Eisenbacteria bacterium]
MAKRGILARLLTIDRRWIFVVIGLATALPLLFPVNLPVAPTPRTQAFHRAIEEVPDGSPILLSLDFEPDIMAELQPMSIAVLRHCFRKNLKPVILTNYPAGPGLIERALAIASEAEGKKRNEDFVFLGYKSGSQTVILGIGESIRALFPEDFYGTRLGDIPLMKGLNSYRDFPLVVNVSGSAIADYYIRIAATRYHKKLILACTAVMATDYYPYLSSGQLLGLVGGMKGAAEYERLLGLVGDARRGMDAQSLVHVLVVLLVVLGNVALMTAGRPPGGGAGGTGGGA